MEPGPSIVINGANYTAGDRNYSRESLFCPEIPPRVARMGNLMQKEGRWDNFSLTITQDLVDDGPGVLLRDGGGEAPENLLQR